MPIPQHYTVNEVAERLHINHRTVRKLFRGLDGVLNIPGPTKQRTKTLIPVPLFNEWYQRRGGRPEIEETDRAVK